MGTIIGLRRKKVVLKKIFACYNLSDQLPFFARVTMYNNLPKFGIL